MLPGRFRTRNWWERLVPTPIDAFKTPDLTPLTKASESVGSVLKAGDIVIYESTVYPGATKPATLLAVPHNEYAMMSPEDLRGYLKESGVLYDLKGILPLGKADLRL